MKVINCLPGSKMRKLVDWLNEHEWEWEPINGGRGVYFINCNEEAFVKTEADAEALYEEIRMNDRDYHEFSSMSGKVFGTYERDFQTEDEWNISPLYQLKWTDKRENTTHGLLGLAKVNVESILKALRCFTRDELEGEALQKTKTRLLRNIENDIEDAFGLFNQRQYRVSIEDIKNVKYLKSQLEGLSYVVK